MSENQEERSYEERQKIVTYITFKVICTGLVIGMITFFVGFIGEYFSAAKAGLAVHQLNGTDVSYSISVLISRLQDISIVLLSLLAILVIWKKEIMKIF